MAADPAASPLPNSYWVLPGRLLAGEYPAALRVAEYVTQGIDCFVDLTQPEELEPYDSALPEHVEYLRKPIPDHGVPIERDHMHEILGFLQDRLRKGRRIYVHCRAGIGRTGTVIGCLLVERGLPGKAALTELNRLWQQCSRSVAWPEVPETDEQARYVREWQSRQTRIPLARSTGRPMVLDHDIPARERFHGALLGLAVGDALAVPTTGRKSDGSLPITDMIGGGAEKLPRGAWTDDTAMALCLAESLLECGGFDARDQVSRYTQWQQAGHLSATGRCIGITASTAKALSAALWRRQVFAGSHDPKQLDAEVLSRVAPAVMFAFPSPHKAAQLACEAARTTCQAPAALDACRLLAAILVGAIEGRPREDLFHSDSDLYAAADLRPPGLDLIRERVFLERPRRPPANVLTALSAALWAFHEHGNFRDGALAVANLHGQSDVATAAYGQLAGAWYGARGIPEAWRNGLARIDVLVGFADRLFEHAL